MQETWVHPLGQEEPLEKEMATHSSILAWEIQWTEEPGRLQFMGLWRVGHDWSDLAQYSTVKFFLYAGCKNVVTKKASSNICVF